MRYYIREYNDFYGVDGYYIYVNNLVYGIRIYKILK
jgi:hypothetical protein